MQQRQLRLGDILDDYCPRERRLTNHAVVAMVGDEVKQTRCTTCDADHEYKHARVPRLRKKESPAGLTAQVLATAPKRVVAEPQPAALDSGTGEATEPAAPLAAALDSTLAPGPTDLTDLFDFDADAGDETEEDAPVEIEGPAHRRLIRATLPRTENTPPVVRQAPDFTIRQPTGGRPNRFRPRPPQRPGQSFQGNRSSGTQGGGGQARGGTMPRHGQGGGRPAAAGQRPVCRHDGGGRKRSK